MPDAASEFRIRFPVNWHCDHCLTLLRSSAIFNCAICLAVPAPRFIFCGSMWIPPYAQFYSRADSSGASQVSFCSFILYITIITSRFGQPLMHQHYDMCIPSHFCLFVLFFLFCFLFVFVRAFRNRWRIGRWRIHWSFLIVDVFIGHVWFTIIMSYY